VEMLLKKLLENVHEYFDQSREFVAQG